MTLMIANVKKEKGLGLLNPSSQIREKDYEWDDQNIDLLLMRPSYH